MTDISLSTILCTTDFSAHAPKVIRYASGLAEKLYARLLIFHSIYDPHSQPDGLGEDLGLEEPQDKIRQAYEKLHELAGDLHIPWEPIVTLGDPVEEVSRVISEGNVDLIVAASYGQSGIKRLLVGSVIERMTRLLAIPIFIAAPPGKHGPEPSLDPVRFRRILVGTEFPPPQSLMDYAVLIASAYQADIHVLHSLEHPDEICLDGSGSLSFIEVQKNRQRELLNRLERQTNETAEFYTGGELTTHLATGLPGEELIHFARENQVDLIIVGAKHHSGFTARLTGSTTKAILKHAPCPILSIPLPFILRKGNERD